MSKSFVKVKDLDFTVDGKPLLFQGLGVGNFLNLEHFMIGLPGTDLQIRSVIQDVYGEKNSADFWNAYYETYMSEADFAYLKSLGINSIRLPINYRIFESDTEPYQYKESGFIQIDRILKFCEKQELYVFLDLHTVPGGQNPDWHSDNAVGESLFWQYPEFQDRVIGLWKYIAARYKDNRWIAGYDLMNEASNYTPGEMVAHFYEKLAMEVRKIDPNHMLILGGDMYGQEFSYFKVPQDPNTAFTFHTYPYMDPKLDFKYIKEEIFRKFMGEKIFDPVHKRLGRPLWCGETGADSQPQNLLRNEAIVKTSLSLFEKNNISWNLWNYKDARSMGILRPKADSPWMKISWEIQKDHYFLDELMQTFAEADALENEAGYKFDPVVKKKLAFRLLANKQLLAVEKFRNVLRDIRFEDFLAALDSFSFRNCERWESYINMIRDFTGLRNQNK